MHARLQELDLLRGLAILGVIVIHASAWSISTGAAPLSSPLALAADFARVAVPLFVLASGFALRTRYRAGVDDSPRFLGRRWRRTLVPWLIWVPVFALVGFQDGAVQASPGGLGSWIAYGAGHLYFLLLIAQLYVVFLLLPASSGRLAAVAVVALALQVALGWLHTYRPAPAGGLGWPFGTIAYWMSPYYAGYFLAGALLSDLWPRLRSARALAAGSAFALLAAGAIWLWSTTTVPADPSAHGAAAFLWPGRVPLVLTLAVALLAWGPRLASAALQWLGSRSLGVYLAHPIFLAFAGPPALALGPVARVAALGAGALAFGVLVAVVLPRTRLGAQALGDEAPVPPAARRRSVARLSLR